MSDPLPDAQQRGAGMKLRWAVPGDASSLARLYREVWSREVEALGAELAAKRSPDAETVRSWIEADPYFVLEGESGIIASLGCELRHGTLHLVHLVVHPDFRRLGCARRLMLEAEAFAREAGVAKIWFDTAPGLEASRRLYEAFGYKICGHLRKHYWGTDILLYEKML